MINVTLNRTEFEYDIHSLLKAFFPKEDVGIYYTKEAKAEEKNVACTSHFVGNEGDATNHFVVTYGEDSITVDWLEQKKIRFTVDFTDRNAVRNLLKRNLYLMLEEVLGTQLPWGTLTGIRPVKIVMKMLEEGKSDAEILSCMKEIYLASEDKTALSIEIAKREQKLLSKLDYKNGYSLYIGIPFCPSTCLYCSFTSYPLAAWENQVDAYLDALEKEIAYTAAAFADKKLNAVYIGGGTPTTLKPYQLKRLIGKLQDSFDFGHCLEFTVEAGRPDSVTEDKLSVLREHGIDRISINPQTMKQETLNLIGRHHTVEQTVESFWLARKMGFDNINMDLILGLPGEDINDVRNTLEEITKLAPDSLTVHSLAVKRAAGLNIYKEHYEKMRMENTAEHMDLCREYCRQMELFPYYLYRQKGMAGNMENVGYAKEGKAGVYNILIMEEKQTIVALGAGASTKYVRQNMPEKEMERILRAENVKDVRSYIERIDEMIERKRKIFPFSSTFYLG